MCVIIDVNQSDKMLRPDVNPHFSDLIRWVNKGGTVYSGGKLHQELGRVVGLLGLLASWEASGRLRILSAGPINSLAEQLSDACVSDDSHIVALAIISGAELIVTADKALMKDMKNLALVSTRRKIYPCEYTISSGNRRHKLLLDSLRCTK